MQAVLALVGVLFGSLVSTGTAMLLSGSLTTRADGRALLRAIRIFVYMREYLPLWVADASAAIAASQERC